MEKIKIKKLNLFIMIIIVKYILAIISKFLTITMPCSFCSQPGHYITNCPSPTIDVVYGMCRTEYQNIMLIKSETLIKTHL